MKRGEIWTLQDKNYASKARPVVVIQSDKHDAFDSVILCLFTTFAHWYRVLRTFCEHFSGVVDKIILMRYDS